MIQMRVPGDKSLTHRALMFAAIARGTSRVRRVLVSEDTESTARVLRQVGADIPELAADATIEIAGRGLRSFHTPDEALDCFNSGTTTRLMMGLVAGQHVSALFTGDSSLRMRPMRRVTTPLAEMGAQVTELGRPGCLPIRIDGDDLRPYTYSSPHASAQIKSALLLAGLVSGVPVEVREPSASRDHTERMLRAMGADITEETKFEGDHIAHFEPSGELEALDLTVPGDFSSAAFLIAAALLGVVPTIRLVGVGVNPTRTGFLDVLEEMGADITLENARDEGGEPVADIVARASELRGTEIGGATIPRMIDEVPVLAILAARATGRTTVRDAAELRVKESDRINAIVTNLRRIGGQAEELDDGLIVEGTTKSLAGPVDTMHDHRIAMAFGVLAHEKANNLNMAEPDVVAVSFPEFWEVLHEHRT